MGLKTNDFCVGNLVPEDVRHTLLDLYRQDKRWFRYSLDDQGRLSHAVTVRTSVGEACSNVMELQALYALSVWLGEGPKVFRMTPQQQEALSNIDMRLKLPDYSQPYQAVLIETDFPPFATTFCYHDPALPVFLVHLWTRRLPGGIPDDRDGPDAMAYFCRDDVGMEDVVAVDLSGGEKRADQVRKCMRVALNACLALSNYGHRLEHLLPQEVARDKSFAREDSDRGRRARDRLPLYTQVLSFAQDVKLYHSEGSHGGTGEGGEKRTHWRRGHWARQPHGEGNSLRKLVFRKPVLVRADLFGGDLADTSVTYKA